MRDTQCYWRNETNLNVVIPRISLYIPLFSFSFTDLSAYLLKPSRTFLSLKVSGFVDNCRNFQGGESCLSLKYMIRTICKVLRNIEKSVLDGGVTKAGANWTHCIKHAIAGFRGFTTKMADDRIKMPLTFHELVFKTGLQFSSLENTWEQDDCGKWLSKRQDRNMKNDN